MESIIGFWLVYRSLDLFKGSVVTNVKIQSLLVQQLIYCTRYDHNLVINISPYDWTWRFLTAFNNILSLSVRVNCAKTPKQSWVILMREKKGKLTHLETRNLAVRSLFAVRPFIMKWAFPFGIVAILGFVLISTTYSREEVC